MIRTFPIQGKFGCLLCPILALSACAQLFPQSAEKKREPFNLASPVKFEVAERFDPADRFGKTSMDRFKVSSGSKTFQMQYSNQPPLITAGRQFQSLPGGYNIAEVLMKRKWGTFHSFQSHGYNLRMVPPASVRSLTGIGIEMPKSFLGTRVSGLVLRASPIEIRSSAMGMPSSARQGSQVILSLSRDWKKGFKLQSEFSRSWRGTPPGYEGPEAGQGVFFRLGGNIRKTETALTYRSQGEGLVNPAMPVRGRKRNLFVLDLRRNYKKHIFLYNRQFDSQAPIKSLRVPLTDLNQNSLSWTYSPRILPQITALKSWSSQDSPGRGEKEENLRLSINKNMKRINLGLSWLRAGRITDPAFRPLWERSGITFDASLAVHKDRRLTLHYEHNDLMLLPVAQLLSTEAMQLQTRLSLWGEAISFMPLVDYRQQEDSHHLMSNSLLSMVLATLLKLPRFMPGKDLLLTFSSRQMSAAGRPDQKAAGLVVQWNLKRL